MVDTLAQFFGVIGLNTTPPQTMAELIPYLLTVFLGIALIAAIFKMFKGIVMFLMGKGGRF